MNVALYVRVSTSEQALEGYSIGEQTARLTKYAEAHNWNIYNVYTDAGFSGGNKNRPALQQLIKDIDSGMIHKVIVYKLDRLSRSQKDTLSLIEDNFLAHDVDFISMQENFDTGSPFGRAMIGILAVFAQLEREQITERMNMGREARAKAGYYTGNREPPIGYDYVDNELVINDYEALAVRRMYDLAQEGKAAYTIAKMLTEEGYKPRRESWVFVTIQKILKSRIYIGEVSFSQKWYPGRHKPIISKEQFDAVQEITKERSSKTKPFYRNFGKATSYFAGFLVCGQCGGKFYKQSNQCQSNNKIYYVYYYKCLNRTHYRQANHEPCKSKYYRQDVLEQQIFDEMKKLAVSPEYFNKIKQDAPKITDTKKAITSEIAKVDKQIAKLVDLYGVGSVPLNVLENKIKLLNDQKRNLNEQFDALADQKKQAKKAKELEKTIKEIPKILETGTFDEIRALIGALIDKVVLDGENIDIYWRF